jgi:hypothetical protein
VIADLPARCEAAERGALPHTAKSWRDQALIVESKSASEMTLAGPIGNFDISESMLVVAGSSQ